LDALLVLLNAIVQLYARDGARVGSPLRPAPRTVLPELRQLPGFQGATNLVDRGNNKVLGITYWQTEADLQASGASITHPRIQERLAKVSIFFAAAPIADNYEVFDQE
jgi:hypothetical protein